MTDTDINKAISGITGANKLVGLKKRGMWYRPNAHGYTWNEPEAWRLTQDEAKKHEYLRGSEPVTIERFSAPDYCNDLNCIVSAVRQSFGLTSLKLEFTEQLTRACKTDGWVILDASDAFDLVNATARQRAEAFLRAHGKWVQND